MYEILCRSPPGGDQDASSWGTLRLHGGVNDPVGGPLSAMDNELALGRAEHTMLILVPIRQIGEETGSMKLYD